jgi:Bacterial regulatory proteins, luxR family
VAASAAIGRSNKAIAAELFMGVSTVEAHLSAVYRKTGVRRAELGTWLRQGRRRQAGGGRHPNLVIPEDSGVQLSGVEEGVGSPQPGADGLEDPSRDVGHGLQQPVEVGA